MLYNSLYFLILSCVWFMKFWCCTQPACFGHFSVPAKLKLLFHKSVEGMELIEQIAHQVVSIQSHALDCILTELEKAEVLSRI